MEDCAFESFTDHWELRELAQLRPAAAGLERSAAHPANEVGPSKNVGAQHRPFQNIDELAPGMEARRAETIELKQIKVRSDGLGLRQPGLRSRGALNSKLIRISHTFCQYSTTVCVRLIYKPLI